MRIPAALLLGLLLPVALTPAAEPNHAITVEAGEFDRRETVVTFALPRNAGQPTAARRDGKLLPLQVADDGQASFRIDELKKGARAVFALVTDASPAPLRTVVARRDSSKLKFTDGTRALLEYQAESGALPRDDIKPAFARGGYLHPIVTPSGRLVTDDFPPNHIHHHGIWAAWTRTEFQGRQPDFWNMGAGKGRVEFVALNAHWSGPVHGGFRSRHRYVNLTAPAPLVALDEAWEMKAYAASAGAPSWWMFDLVSTQRCATADPLKLPPYHYGGLGLRGHRTWNGRDATHFLTSDGETDRVKAHATRGRWCDMSGEVDGARAGLAILCHPDNFRAPHPMRIHPTEPFFCYAPQQAGDMAIQPGETYVARYRIVVHDGPPNRAELDRLWNDYAHPPAVKVEEQ